MLHLVYGRSGSGKTRYALDAANEAAKSGRETVLIVPEQFTFETERTLVRDFGPQSCLNIEALSFSRLVHRVMSVYGGLASRTIDDCGRYILMRLALKQVDGMLKVYARQASGAPFVKAMVDAVGEYKVCGIDADTLDEAAKRSGGGILRQKVEDISLIMRTYCALLENGLADPLDELSWLAKKLGECDFFEGKAVIFDGFKGFTPQERAVIGKILCRAQDVTVTLCADSSGNGGAAGLFSPVEKTARQLIALANECGCAIASPVRLSTSPRFENESLRALERSLFRPGAPIFEPDAKEIHIVSTQNVYDEAKFAACEITRLVRETGCRYGDIALISRSLELFDGILDPVFEQYGIPLFYDCRRSIETHPMMALVLSLLDMMTANFRQEHVLRYLKTGLAGFTVEEASRLENYLLIWDIRGAEQWENPWRGSPNGFEAAERENDAQELDSLNELRERLYEPVLKLTKQMEGGGMARALYGFLCETGVREAVTAACRDLKENGETRLAEEYAQIWEKFVSLLDQITLTVKEETLTLREFAELFRLAVANADLGSIPPTLDAVAAGDAERTRTGGAKVVFVLGLAEGIFPQPAASGGLISDAERRRLISFGLELSPPAEEQAADERFFAYKAFTCASESVYLSCPRGDATGRALRPSYFLSAVKKLFPRCDERNEPFEDPLFAVVNKKTAFDLLARHYTDSIPLSGALKSIFCEDDSYAPRLAALSRASGKQRLHFSNAATARALYGEDMHISPSRVEAFGQCRFLYFCRYGMHAKPRRRAGLDAPEIGTVIHFVLERLLSQTKETGLAGVPEEKLAQITSELLGQFAEGYLGGLEDKPERFRHLFANLAETVLCLVRHLAEEFAQSGFAPADFELVIAPGGDVAPYELALPDGGRLVVGGKVDRVDTMQVDGKTYLRVVDYKTGGKTFNLNDLVYGLNLQMFIYLFTLWQNAGGRYAQSGEILPAGVLYVPAKKPDVAVLRDTPEEEVRAAADRELRMNGLLVDEPDVILGMESSGAGRFIPAMVKKDADSDGAIRYAVSGRSSVASLEQFGILKRHIETTLREMATSLRRGDAFAVPASGLSYHPCDYCDYACVCGFEPGGEVRNLPSVEKDEIWNSMKGESADGEGMDKPAE